MKQSLSEQLKEFLSTEEGQAETRRFFEDLRNEKETNERHVDTFHQLYGNDPVKYGDLLDRIIEKYSSDKYKEKWYSKGVEPPEDLFWLIYDHAVKYSVCEIDRTSPCFQQNGSSFTEALYSVHGFYIQKLNGQGCCVLVNRDRIEVLHSCLGCGRDWKVEYSRMDKRTAFCMHDKCSECYEITLDDYDHGTLPNQMFFDAEMNPI